MSPSKPAAIRVLIVEDHRIVAEALGSLLSEDEAIDVVGTAASVAGATSCADRLHPDVVIMDFRLPDGDGTVAAQKIRQGSPSTAILFLSADPSDEAMMQALEAGACGYLSKESRSEDLLLAIRRAAEGEFLVPAATMSHLFTRQREIKRERDEQARIEEDLTERERQVLRLMTAGCDNHDISEELGIAYGTVRTHVRSVLEKLGAHSRLHAVALCRQKGLLGLDQEGVRLPRTI